MSIQQSFNQGLMGTTFLLGQVPAFKQAQENALQVSQVTNAAKSVNKTAAILKKHYGDNNVPTEAQSIVNSNVGTMLGNASKSPNPKVAAGAIIAMDERKQQAKLSEQTAGMLREAAIEVQKEQQAKLSETNASMLRKAAIEVQKEQQAKQTAANDLEKRMSDNDIVRNVVKNLRGKGLSGNQVKKVLYAVDKSEKEAQNGTNKQ